MVGCSVGIGVVGSKVGATVGDIGVGSKVGAHGAVGLGVGSKVGATVVGSVGIGVGSKVGAPEPGGDIASLPSLAALQWPIAQKLPTTTPATNIELRNNAIRINLIQNLRSSSDKVLF
jgi:hypothetical protein